MHRTLFGVASWYRQCDDLIAYYGFGPWFSWSFAQRYPEAKPSVFIEMLRRAEVLLALIGAYHALKHQLILPTMARRPQLIVLMTDELNVNYRACRRDE